MTSSSRLKAGEWFPCLGPAWGRCRWPACRRTRRRGRRWRAWSRSPACPRTSSAVSPRNLDPALTASICLGLQSPVQTGDRNLLSLKPFHTFIPLARDLTLELNYLQLFSVLAILFEPIWLGFSRSTKNCNFRKWKRSVLVNEESSETERCLYLTGAHTDCPLDI